MSEPGEVAAAQEGHRPATPQVPLRTVLRKWGPGSGCIGFGGPPAHIRLLRQLCVERKGWLDTREFEDAIAVCNLMPDRPPPSWPSSAPGGCAAAPAPSSAGQRSSCPA